MGVSAEQHIISALPDVQVKRLNREDDFLVIGCDGIWDMLSSQECVDFVYHRMGNMPLEEIAR